MPKNSRLSPDEFGLEPSGLEIKIWASAVAVASRLELRHFGQQLVFENDSATYHLWIKPEFCMLMLDLFDKSTQTEQQLFQGAITLGSLDQISQILNPPNQPAKRRPSRRFP